SRSCCCSTSSSSASAAASPRPRSPGKAPTRSNGRTCRLRRRTTRSRRRPSSSEQERQNRPGARVDRADDLRRHHREVLAAEQRRPVNVETKPENKRLSWRLAVVAVGMFGFGYALVPFYYAICAAWDVGNLDTRAERPANSQVDLSRTVTIEFDS